MKKFCYATALGLLITFGFLANALFEIDRMESIRRDRDFDERV